MKNDIAKLSVFAAVLIAIAIGSNAHGRFTARSEFKKQLCLPPVGTGFMPASSLQPNLSHLPGYWFASGDDAGSTQGD